MCLCLVPLPTAAGGNGRVQPFPRMRISFLPLSRDPEVSTQQPQGARPRGQGFWLGGGGTDPPARSPGCSSQQDPPVSPTAWLGPHDGQERSCPRERGSRFAACSGWGHGAISFSVSPRLRPLPFAQPKCPTGARVGSPRVAELVPTMGCPSCDFWAPSPTKRAWRSCRVQQGDPQHCPSRSRAPQPPQCLPAPPGLLLLPGVWPGHGGRWIPRKGSSCSWEGLCGEQWPQLISLRCLTEHMGLFPGGMRSQGRPRVGIPPGSSRVLLGGGFVGHPAALVVTGVPGSAQPTGTTVPWGSRHGHSPSAAHPTPANPGISSQMPGAGLLQVTSIPRGGGYGHA